MENPTLRRPTRSGAGVTYTLRETNGRVEVLPHAVPDVLTDVAKTVQATMWPGRAVTDRLPGDLEQLDDVAYWATARCLNLLSYLAADMLPAGQVLDALLETPRVHVSEPDTDYEQSYVPMNTAEALAGQVALPDEVWALVHGRLVHALVDWPPTTADVITDLVAASAPKPVEGESAGNRAYGARLAARLLASWVAMPAARWPLAAAWASAHLVHEWVSFGASVPEDRRPFTIGLAPYSSHRPLPDGVVLPTWADLIPAVQA